MKAISLFTGAGGMDVGFDNAGFEIVLANEIDKNAAASYQANHPKSNIIVSDINKIIDRFDEYKGIDLVFGGPPCQGFSVIGKMNPEDTRSQLIWSFLKVVEKTQPKAFVMENVKALAYIQKWKPVKEKYIKRAEQLGYKCIPFILNAAEFGVSQKRERVFFIGFQTNEIFEEKLLLYLNEQKRKAPVIRDLFKDLGPAGTEKNPKTCSAKITFAVKPVMRKIPYDCLMFNGIGRPIDPDGYSRTITASMGGNMTLIVDELFLHDKTSDNWIQDYYNKLISGEIIPEFKEAPSRLRRLTINETKRLQTFPDEYIFCGAKTSIYRQLGNAVPCELAKAVALAVKKYLETEM